MKGGFNTYVALGGIDGTGKSTIQRMLADRLSRGGLDVVSFAEPHHGFVKELLEETEDPWADVLLFALDRWLLRPKIEDWLSQGKALISSRSLYCSVAYQGAQGIAWEDILEANQWESLILPDLYVILDADPSLAYSRSSGREKFEDRGFLAKVRSEYREIFRESKRFPSRMSLIDATPPVREVFDGVMAIVEDEIDLGDE
jgi:dTMP kinase